MVRYSYFYNAELDLHVVMVSRDNPDNTVSVRPVAAYYQAKSAQMYVQRKNEYLDSKRKGNPPRLNPPVQYFSVPDWWTAKHPNWNKMVKRA